MKKLLFLLGFLFSCGNAFAYHNFFFRDAGDIISGTLSNERLDKSSVTLRGQLTDGTQVLTISSATMRGTITTTDTLKGGALVVPGNLTLNTLAYTFPGSRGTNGTVLKEDGSGNLTWGSDQGGNNARRSFDVTVGTLGAISGDVDIASSNVDGLVAALQLLQARGLTASATAYGTILYRGGTFDIAEATIPAGITVYSIPGSSTSWRLTATTGSIVTVYGKMENISFDCGGLAFSGALIIPKSGSKMTNVRVFGAQRAVGAASSLKSAAIFKVESATNVSITGDINGYLAQDGVSFAGDAPTVLVNKSTDVYISLNSKNGTRAVSNASFIGVIDSVNVTIANSEWKDCGGRHVLVGSGSLGTRVLRNTAYLTESAGLQGVFTISANRTASRISSGTVFADNYIDTNGISTAIWYADTADVNSNVLSLTIANNVVRNLTTSNCIILQDARVLGTTIRDNKVDGANAFISDTGTNTKYTGLGNFFNSVEQ